MTNKASKLFGAACDRCGSPYLIGQFPNLCLCPACYLGALAPTERGRLIGYIHRTGSRVP
jgi:hypothetical protein